MEIILFKCYADSINICMVVIPLIREAGNEPTNPVEDIFRRPTHQNSTPWFKFGVEGLYPTGEVVQVLQHISGYDQI